MANNNFLKKSSSVSFHGTYKTLTSPTKEKNLTPILSMSVNKPVSIKMKRPSDLIYRSPRNLCDKIKIRNKTHTHTHTHTQTIRGAVLIQITRPLRILTHAPTHLPRGASQIILHKVFLFYLITICLSFKQLYNNLIELKYVSTNGAK